MIFLFIVASIIGVLGGYILTDMIWETWVREVYEEYKKEILGNER